MIEKNPFHQPVPDVGPSLFSDPAMALIGATLLLIVFASRWRSTRRRMRGRSGKPSRKAVLPFEKKNSRHAPTDRKSMHLPENQVMAIAEANFETQPLLNKSEARLLPVIEDALAGIGCGHRVMAQTSLGELLRPSDAQSPAIKDAAYAAINAKRFDFAIIDRRNRLVAAIEYQGSGHYRKTSFIRDAVKREACRKADVAFVEVHPGTRAGDLVEQLRRLLDPAAAKGAAHPGSPLRDQSKASAAS